MDASLVALLLAVLVLVILDVAVLRWGHDSRPPAGRAARLVVSPTLSLGHATTPKPPRIRGGFGA